MPEPLRWDMTLPNGEPLRWDSPQFVWDGFVPENLNPNQPMQQNLNSTAITQTQEDAIITKAGELRALIEAVTVAVPDDRRADLFRLGGGRMMYDQKCDQ